MTVGVKSKIEQERKKQIYESEKRKVVGPAEGYAPRIDKETGQQTDPVSVRAKRRRKGEEGHKPTFVGKKYRTLNLKLKLANYVNKVRKAVFDKD